MVTSARKSALVGSLLILLMFLGGCVSTSIGEVGYADNGITAKINNPDGPSDAFVQVMIYQVNGLTQQEYSVVMAPAKLLTGDNTVLIPVDLGPGTYKLKMYLIQSGERKTAVIRDIVV